MYFNKQTGEASVYLPADYLYTGSDYPDLFEEAVLDIVKTYLANNNKKKMSANDFKQARLHFSSVVILVVCFMSHVNLNSTNLIFYKPDFLQKMLRSLYMSFLLNEEDIEQIDEAFG